MTWLRWIVVVIAACTVVLRVIEVTDHDRLDCRPVSYEGQHAPHPNTDGSYTWGPGRPGTWRNADGTVVGHAVEEDSTITYVGACRP